ncbi:hypothetical protein FOZ60_001884 [Perkinsus olseni]|uniref:Uncharacterized protein n=2 Tax=Perkinsus olseni TaxID=32597 RepID=A0A7J6PJV0_PEROL|nr:hypothetical protein FOZ60_001884 [Perkinsus olseni]
MEQLKGHGTMRKREAGVVSIMKEISATKVMVVDYSLPPPEVARYMTTHTTTTTKSSVHVNVFNVALFENDAGANTKITLAGLVPVGGKTEKFGLKLMAEREVK